MKIGIVGLGLIGGSIYKRLQTKYSVIKASDDYLNLIGCDLVFVCTPMGVTLEVLDELNSILTPETIVADVCSLKSFVSKKEYKFNFIPTHPMAGTEKQGFENSFAEMFEGAKWVITKENTELISIIKELGAEAILMSAEEHDKAVALISNLPLIVSQTLCKNIQNNKLAQILAASGFRDTTRLALSNIEMAEDMLSINKENIKDAIISFNSALEELLDKDYKAQAKDIKAFREELYLHKT